ncbi:MAG: NrfD/PsrC family molybdoenzyme membrane anchor subunit [Thermodesulfobacteriota bacterium]
MADGFSLAATAEPTVATPKLNTYTGVFALIALIGVTAGLYGFFAGHHHIYNNTREMPWGILISTYAFLAITSTGLCVLAAISHIYGGTKLAPLANRMVWLSLITIIGGFTLIGLELENPWRMAIYNILTPNLTSNIWWMGTLYGLAVGMMFVEFYLILTKQYKWAVVLGVIGALAEMAANTNLGSVFASLAGHPFWFGAQIPIYFLGCAFLSGAAATILFTFLAMKMRDREIDSDTMAAFQTGGKVMALALLLIGISTAWRYINLMSGGAEQARLGALAILNGPLSFNFWVFEIAIGMIFPLGLLVVTKFKSAPALAFSAFMILVGMFISRYDMVVAGQLPPVYGGLDSHLPALFTYVPSLFEILVTAGGFGIIGAAFLLGERLFGRAFDDHGAH